MISLRRIRAYAQGLLLLCVIASCTSTPTRNPDTPTHLLSCRVQAIKNDLLLDHETGILVAAHRGHHIAHPENSISAIISAADIGADIVEIDVQLTKDAVPVLMHDESLDRTTNAKGNVADYTLAEIKEFRLMSINGDISSETIPTLREALNAARHRIFVDIDLKDTVIHSVLTVVQSEGMLDQVMFYNSDFAVRDRILNDAPDALVMPIAREHQDIESILNQYDLQILHLRETYNSPALADYLDKRGVAGWTNALYEPDEIVRQDGPEAGFGPITQNRPDVIQTDLPEQLILYLQENNLHWTTQENACS